MKGQAAREQEWGRTGAAGEPVLVALSGGVDSAVAAALLVEQGQDVSAAYMKNWMNEDGILGDCPWEEDLSDARAVAQRLGIGFEVVNLMDAYKARIVDYLLQGYADGVTPNPDVLCNREIKFGVFRDWALREGFGSIATGHYARQRLAPDGTAQILTGLDPGKDQSYFLCLMQQEQARDARFPVGGLQKREVRDVARRLHLPVAEKKDSQGICFIGNIRMADFLRAYLPDAPGEIVLPDGQVVGRHQGLHFFTLGQRKGLGVASNVKNEHYVVLEKRLATRELVVGFDRPDTEGLYANACVLGALSYVGQPRGACNLQARARYRAPSVPIRYTPLSGGYALVEWQEPQRALALGQVCALYADEVLVGGGYYVEILQGNERIAALCASGCYSQEWGQSASACKTDTA